MLSSAFSPLCQACGMAYLMTTRVQLGRGGCVVSGANSEASNRTSASRRSARAVIPYVMAVDFTCLDEIEPWLAFPCRIHVGLRGLRKDHSSSQSLGWSDDRGVNSPWRTISLQRGCTPHGTWTDKPLSGRSLAISMPARFFCSGLGREPPPGIARSHRDENASFALASSRATLRPWRTGRSSSG